MRSFPRIAAVALLILCGGRSAHAVSGYVSGFSAAYPAATAALQSCALCHVTAGPPARNSYGAAYAANGHSYRAIEALDSDGDGFTNLAEITAGTFPGSAASQPSSDTAAPLVTAFSVPASSSSLTVPLTVFTATDNVGVTGYLVTLSAALPSATAAGWRASAPGSYTVSAPGTLTLFAWARDAAGNVSASRSAAVRVSAAVTDRTRPVITAFRLPATSSSREIRIAAFTATDNRGVTGYMVRTGSSRPSPAAAGWQDAAPTTVTVPRTGRVEVYAWVKDAAGNLSVSRRAVVRVTVGHDEDDDDGDENDKTAALPVAAKEALLAAVDASGVAAGQGLWDLTGTYRVEVAGRPLVLSLVHRAGGSLAGTATYTVAADSVLSLPITGSVHGAAGEVLATLVVKGARSMGTTAVTLTLKLALDAAARQLTGVLRGSVRAGSETLAVATITTLDLPPAMDGTWTLLYAASPPAAGAAPTALLTLSNGADCLLTASPGSPVDSAVTLTLAGDPAETGGRGLAMVATLLPEAGSMAKFQACAGTLYGQTLAW